MNKTLRTILNKKINILILGYNGMLGHDVYQYFYKLSQKDGSGIGKVIGIGSDSDINVLIRHELGAYFLDSIHFDYCINCIAYTDTHDAQFSENGKLTDYKLNAIVPKNVSESCMFFKTHLIHISTDYVFSENSGSYSNHFPCDPYGINSNEFPVNNYGMDKLLGEKFIQQNFAKWNKGYSILRVSWLYGMHKRKSFIHKFIKNAYNNLLNNKSLELQMTSNEFSVPTSTDFVVQAINDVIDNNMHGIIHAVPKYSGNGVSRLEFAEEIISSIPENIKVNGLKMNQIKLKPIETHSYYPLYSVMESSNFHFHKYDWKYYLDSFIYKNIESIIENIKNDK